MTETADWKPEQPTPELPPPIGAPSSPLWPGYLFDLFFRPSRFFSENLALGKTPYLLFVTWCYGFSAVLDRIDLQLFRAEMETSGLRRQFLEPVLGSWPAFWVLVSGMAIVSAIFVYFLGGWWYRLRIRWSGHPKADPRLSRYIYVYSSFVFAGPHFLYALMATFQYESYLEASEKETIEGFILLALLFWSIWVGYRGVTASFKVSLWRARLWFVVLPTLIYSTVLVGFAAAVATGYLSAPADLERTKEHSEGFLTFTYPGNWTVDESATGLLSAQVDPPQDALMAIELGFSEDSSLEDEVAAVLAGYEERIGSPCTRGAPLTVLPPLEGFGFAGECPINGSPYELRIFASREAWGYVMIAEIHLAADREKIEPGFELIRGTIKVRFEDD